MQVLRDGWTFDVRDEGPRDGAIVLLLHGFPQTSTSWAPLAALLHAAGYRTPAPDQRGYSPGARPRRVRDYALPELVADALALTPALNWYRAMPFAGLSPGPRVRVPVLHVWGSADSALLRRTTEDARRWVAGPYTFVELPGANHWFPEQRPDAVAVPLLRHLAP